MTGSGRTPSRLELTYIQCASDLAEMIAGGRFPQVGSASPDLDASPRVGDGLMRLDVDGIVTYASPNALSAYRRLGLATDLVGNHLGGLTAELALPVRSVDEAPSVVAGGRPRAADGAHTRAPSSLAPSISARPTAEVPASSWISRSPPSETRQT